MILSVTNLNAFRRYRQDEDMPLEVLMAQLRGRGDDTPNMRAGSALHKLLETGADPDAIYDGHRFTFAGDIEIVLPPIREMRGSRSYNVDGLQINLTARLDGLDGRRGVEHKFTSSGFDATRYCDSYQWRCYLAIFGLQSVTFNVFEGDVDEDTAAPVEVRISALHSITFDRYPELDADVEREIGLFADFARTHLQNAA